MKDSLKSLIEKTQTWIVPHLGRYENSHIIKHLKKSFLYLNFVLLFSSVCGMVKVLNERTVNSNILSEISTKLLLLSIEHTGLIFLSILTFLMFKEKSHFIFYCMSIIVFVTIDRGQSLAARTSENALLTGLFSLFMGAGIVSVYQYVLNILKNKLLIPMSFVDHLVSMIYFPVVLAGILLLSNWPSLFNLIGIVVSWTIDHPVIIFLIVFLEMFFWFIGVNGYGIIAPFVLLFAVSHLNSNLFLIANDMAPQFIFTPNFWDYFISVTGSGVTGAIAILSYFSKKQKIRTIGKSSLLGSLFSVSEPIVFGIPLVMNYYFFVPLVIGTPLLAVFQWYVFKWGWVSPPTFFVADFPLPLAPLLATLDWRALILTLGTVAVATGMYYPFFKAYEKSFSDEVVEDKYDDLDLDF